MASPGSTGGRRARPRRVGRVSDRLPALVEVLGPPVSSLAWSPDFVAQTLEILPVALWDGALTWIKPVHAESLRVGLNPSSTPGATVLDVLKWYPLQPVVVHSTSWRHEDGRVILTYVAAVAPPAKLPPGSLAAVPVGRTSLARGDALSAPLSIGVAAVLEHALRHLAWLVRDDPAVAEALVEWRAALGTFEPEPFRALG